MRGLIAVAVALVLAGCATPLLVQNAPLAARPVGKMPGDTIETIPARLNERAVTLISVVRTFDEGGRLALCGAAVFAAGRKDLGDLPYLLKHHNAQLVLAPDTPLEVRVPPSFMRVYGKEAGNGRMEARTLDFATMEADCIVTTRDWNEAYRAGYRLRLPESFRVPRVP